MTFLQHTFIKPWATAASQEGPALGPTGTSSLLRVAGSGERLGTHRCLLGESGAMEKEKQISRRSSSFTGGSRECSLRVAFQQRPEGRDGVGGGVMDTSRHLTAPEASSSPSRRHVGM